MRLKVSIIALLLVFPGLLLCAGTRGIEEEGDETPAQLTIGKQYAILIGISEYRNWLPLRYPVPDAREMKEILHSRYLFDEVIELYDEAATKENILRTFEILQKKLEPDDSLLILYSGHGYLDKKTDTGFWIPVDAGRDVYKQENWLPNSQVRGLISNIKSIHVLLLVDSCFSGDIIEGTRALQDMDEYFIKAYDRISRFVITSSGSETVPDKSEFAEQLKSVLKRNKKPFMDALVIFDEIRSGMRKTLPLFGGLKDAGHQEGSCFLLFLKEKKLTDGPGRGILPEEKPGQKAKSLMIGIGGAYSMPFLYDNETNILAPSGQGELFATWKAGEFSLFSFFLVISGSYGYYTERENTGYGNNLHLINACGGFILSMDFPFYRAMGMSFSILAGPEFAFRENTFDNETSFHIKPAVMGNTGIHFSISDSLVLFVKGHFVTVCEKEEFRYWYKEFGIGSGIGFRF